MARSIFEKQPFIIPDASKDPRVNPILKEKFNLHSLVVIPLLAKEKALGAIAADFVEPEKNITKEALESVMAFAQQAGLAIHNAFMYQELKTFSQQMEEKIQKTTADLRKTEAQLIRSEKLAALGQLAAGIAHEIRNPLTSINILIHSLTENLPSGDSHREDLKVIEEEIHRINEIVDQFLRFAKPAPPLLEKADVLSIFEETLQLLRPQIEKQRIVVQKEFQSLPIILMDREQMKQVILNLLLNAIQAMPGGGQLDIEGARFQKMVNGSNSPSRTLGWVSPVKIWINSSILSSPRKKEGLASASPLPIGSSTSTMERLRWKAPRERDPLYRLASYFAERKKMQTILIVDDDKSIRYSLKRMMEEKYSILTAQNGEEALDRVKESSPDLIIMDIKMPGRNGIEVLKEIKSIDPKSLVIIMTAYGTTETAIEAMKYGAFDYILKPFPIPQMKGLVEKALSLRKLMKEEVTYAPWQRSRKEKRNGLSDPLPRCRRSTK